MTVLANTPMHHPIFTEGRWQDTAWQHQAVMAAFGDLGGGSDARANGQVLFRLEPDRPAHDGTDGRVLIQANTAPAVDGVRVTDLDPVLDGLTAGQPARLLLRANTVRTINRTGPDGTTRRHRARVPDADLEGWFKHRLEGAAELAAPISTTPWDLKRGRAQLITTTFLATATVTDPARLATLARDGVGRAKAYGCGMLSVLPIQN